MGKAEKGTPKDIANRMKAKGLQKLRWYCQMCQKQCRDENGFKCHTTSESHQRQLLLFADDPDKYLDSFSEEFFEGFISLLKRRFNTKRVHANNVYQEYIHDRDHVHMNATKWETLTDFVKWMGREGYCVVDETEKGWYIAWVDRDPETLLKDKLKRKKEKIEKDEEDRFQDFINKQIEMGKMKNVSETEYSELQREPEESIKLDIKLSSKSKEEPSKISTNPLLLKSGSSKPIFKKEPASKKRSALEEIIEEEKRRKKKLELEEMSHSTNMKVAENSWLTKNIVVKVITKELGSKYYKLKGVIIDVLDKYLALVQIFDTKQKLKLDQAHLETVIPSVGREVLILSGKYKGMTAILKSLEVEKFSATLLINSDPYRDCLMSDIPYEQFSKLHV